LPDDGQRWSADFFAAQPTMQKTPENRDFFTGKDWHDSRVTDTSRIAKLDNEKSRNLK